MLKYYLSQIDTISKKISFLDIYKVIKKSLDHNKKIKQKDLKNNIEHILSLNQKKKNLDSLFYLKRLVI